MSCEYGLGPDRPGVGRRHSGAVRCHPAATAATKQAQTATATQAQTATATAVATTAAADEDWRFDIAQTAGHTVVTEVAGEIDLRTGRGLRKRLLELADAGFGRIVIDFGEVRFCDASGLGVLVAVQNRLRPQGGHLVLARVRPAQRRLLRVAGLHGLFPLHDSVAAAVSAGQEPTAAPLG
jgi:anti-anti-sigma factor